MEEVLNFLRDLSQNNDRVWFQDNKKRYEDVKAAHEQFLKDIITHLSLFDPEIGGLNPKDTVFRIYRDVRFSNDKSPYKTQIGAYLAKGGKKSPNAGYYIHLEPDNCFLSAGIWCPESTVLKALREDVFNNLEEFKAIVGHPAFVKDFVLEGDKLKKVPLGYPKDSPDAEWVKYKSYLATSKKSEDFFRGVDSAERCANTFSVLVPLVKFLNYSVDEFLDRT